MIVVDTSVWIDHLRRPDEALSRHIAEAVVAIHPLVIEEIACGHLQHRTRVLSELAKLPMAPVASHDEILHFIERHRLGGSGLGPVDVHLLASAHLAHALLFSRDAALNRAATTLGISAA